MSEDPPGCSLKVRGDDGQKLVPRHYFVVVVPVPRSQIISPGSEAAAPLRENDESSEEDQKKQREEQAKTRQGLQKQPPIHVPAPFSGGKSLLGSPVVVARAAGSGVSSRTRDRRPSGDDHADLDDLAAPSAPGRRHVRNHGESGARWQEGRSDTFTAISGTTVRVDDAR